MDDDQSQDICRVCRCEATSDRPLFYPCICTGSIKYIHQDCLMQWMRYSHKQFCELCGHRFRFQPIYSPDMPRVLPLRDVIGGLLSAVMQAAKSWLHYTIVGLAWFGLVPLTAYRTYRSLFHTPSFDVFMSLRFESLSTENLLADAFRGCFVVTCTLLSFIGLVWLREQILHGGGPDWLDQGHFAAPAQDANGRNRNEDVPAGAAEVLEPFVGEGADQHINNGEPPDAGPRYRDGGMGPAVGAGIDRVHAAFRAVAVDVDNENDEPNWNPMGWDRAAEELTWERLFGLDGSLLFLEHVFWIISLNVMFIFIFAFCPYCFGNFIINALEMLQPEESMLHLHGLITTLIGYCFLGISLVILHAIASFFHLQRLSWVFGFCYIVVKVSLLSVVEIGVLPLICGWWLDICSLPLFDASLKDRKTSFRAAPGTSLFVHWMFGMVYVYYFAVFISLLREVLRPGVLWFLRNVNDPDFSPMQETIHLSIFRHMRRLIASTILFGSIVMLMLWLPINILKVIWPTFLPYTLSGDSEVNELSLQLLLLQIVLPGFFEQSHTRIWLKGLLRIWCKAVSYVLGIHSYLLGVEPQLHDEFNARMAPEQAAAEEANRNVPGQPEAAENMPNASGAGRQEAEQEEVPPRIQEIPELPPAPLGRAALGALHQALLQRDAPLGHQPYKRPSFFAVRLCGLVVFVAISLIISSLITIIVPVWLGRQIMTFWSIGGIITSSSPVVQHVAGKAEVSPRPHELYSAALGTYLCWVLSRAIAIIVNLVPLGRTVIMDKLKQWLRVAATYAVPVLIFLCLLSIIPLLFGILLELIVVIPLRVPWSQTPVHFLWQYWALGVLYTKIAIALTLMGPDWAMKRALERAYRDGLRDIDMKFLICELAAPIVISLGLALSVPYVLALSIMPLFVQDADLLLTTARIIYPLCFVILLVIAYVYFEINQFKKLYLTIKVDKYLVGQRLVNYVDKKRKQEAEAASQRAKELANSAILANELPVGESANVNVPLETIKEPVPPDPILNDLDLDIVDFLRHGNNSMSYGRHPQNELQNEVGFGNELL